MRRTTACATMMVVCAGLVVVAGIGCSVAPSGEELATVTEDIQRSEPSAERAGIERSLRSEDLVDMAAMEAQLAAACPVPFDQCEEAGYDSCFDWSTTTSCGTPVCGSGCRFCNSKGFCFSLIRRTTFTTRARVCLNQAGDPCNEFEVVSSTACDGECCTLNPDMCDF